MTAQDPGVYITPAQTYAEVRELGKAVGRMEAKLDEVLRETTDIRGDVQDHEARIRTLEAAPKAADVDTRVTAVDTRLAVMERARWPLPSIAALIGVAALGMTVYDRLGR